MWAGIERRTMWALHSRFLSFLLVKTVIPKAMHYMTSSYFDVLPRHVDRLSVKGHQTDWIEETNDLHTHCKLELFGADECHTVALPTTTAKSLRRRQATSTSAPCQSRQLMPSRVARRRLCSYLVHGRGCRIEQLQQTHFPHCQLPAQITSNHTPSSFLSSMPSLSFHG